jgi:hypothetical protein
LATSILDDLEQGEEFTGARTSSILYHFFQFDSETSRSPAAAFRSFLLQIIWCYRHDRNIVDKFAFVMMSRPQGQLDASEETLVDLLQTCLNNTAVIIVDGVDECKDSESFITSLLQLSLTCIPRILILSRINVPRLQRTVRSESRLPLPKPQLSLDIHRFCDRELRELVDDEILPDLAPEELEHLADHLVNGADGMFLWARLMMEFLRSPALSQQSRIRTITEINFPEGLEKMYNRILLLISQSGMTAHNLATRIFTWLVYQAMPMSTRQTRQALAIDGIWTSGDKSEDIEEFENAAIMACRGLVELVPISSLSPSSRTLKFIHLTVRETLTPADPPGTHEDMSLKQDLIEVPQLTIANLSLGSCCLRQLIYHSPWEPLSGRFHESISTVQLASTFPFTDYAAVYWMYHLARIVIPSSKIIGQNERVEKHFEAAFHDFTNNLQRFLKNAKAITAWLEAFSLWRLNSVAILIG